MLLGRGFPTCSSSDARLAGPASPKVICTWRPSLGSAPSWRAASTRLHGHTTGSRLPPISTPHHHWHRVQKVALVKVCTFVAGEWASWQDALAPDVVFRAEAQRAHDIGGGAAVDKHRGQYHEEGHHQQHMRRRRYTCWRTSASRRRFSPAGQP